MHKLDLSESLEDNTNVYAYIKQILDDFFPTWNRKPVLIADVCKAIFPESHGDRISFGKHFGNCLRINFGHCAKAKRKMLYPVNTESDIKDDLDSGSL